MGAEPVLLNGGFEIVEDNADAGKGRAGIFEGGFELVEDDDEIIELGLIDSLAHAESDSAATTVSGRP